ncbi:TetR/AcrR family transcriptional regulator [Microbacterium resistens]|uniref:TetR/AcrR family transcriptional regulator n=1 Tax=Microbacterium resistens TaxID=156977 RepID=UPI001C578C10|nr:TetR/AcrR family transcriptional regulator [Microbacterium resistens]MBW1639753.1 TetR/AcrR family transcriptional regulator [Microbacterium resistens]
MSPPSPAQRPGAAGRPRDPHIDQAVLSAALAILDERGYAELGLEEVATRAGTSRPAIYRRWPGRAPLALAAIASRLTAPRSPDTGCTLCDLDESVTVFLAAYRQIRPDVLTALLADCATEPELRTRYLDTLIEPARLAVGHTLDRAIARGDLRPEVDRELLLDMVGSLVHYLALFGDRHITDAEAEHAIETLLRGAAVDYDALIEHSRALEALEPPSGEHHPHG